MLILVLNLCSEVKCATSVHGRFGGFHLLAIVNNAVVNISVQGPAFHSSGYRPRSGPAGSCGHSNFKVLKNCHNVSHSSCTIFIPSNGVRGLCFIFQHTEHRTCPLPPPLTVPEQMPVFLICADRPPSVLSHSLVTSRLIYLGPCSPTFTLYLVYHDWHRHC